MFNTITNKYLNKLKKEGLDPIYEIIEENKYKMIYEESNIYKDDKAIDTRIAIYEHNSTGFSWRYLS